MNNRGNLIYDLAFGKISDAEYREMLYYEELDMDNNDIDFEDLLYDIDREGYKMK